MLNLHGTLMPLFRTKNTAKGVITDTSQIQYVGVAFHINDQGLIGTCAHVIDLVSSDEILVAVDVSSPNKDIYPVRDVKKHSKYDFAVGVVNRINYQIVPIHGGRAIHMGEEVFAYGFIPDSVINGKWHINQRVFKGHVVCSSDKIQYDIGARSICEISFPSVKGFSGTPIFFDKKETSIAGILFNNHESSIVSHELTEVDDNGNTFSEKVSRIMELGLAHTALDIRTFLHDLGVDRVPLDSQDPEPLDS